VTSPLPPLLSDVPVHYQELLKQRVLRIASMREALAISASCIAANSSHMLQDLGQIFPICMCVLRWMCIPNMYACVALDVYSQYVFVCCVGLNNVWSAVCCV
jgi:hypothetical protein